MLSGIDDYNTGERTGKDFVESTMRERRAMYNELAKSRRYEFVGICGNLFVLEVSRPFAVIGYIFVRYDHIFHPYMKASKL